MQSSHAPRAVLSAFDDPTLVAYGGLEPLVRLAERCGLPGLVGERLRLPATADGTGAFPAAKVMALVAGMAAGADSIADLDRLRHGAMDRAPCAGPGTAVPAGGRPGGACPASTAA